jgi:hypothetical protein
MGHELPRRSQTCVAELPSIAAALARVSGDRFGPTTASRAAADSCSINRELPTGRTEIPIIAMGSTGAVGEHPSFIVHTLKLPEAKRSRRDGVPMRAGSHRNAPWPHFGTAAPLPSHCLISAGSVPSAVSDACALTIPSRSAAFPLRTQMPRRSRVIPVSTT